jgi:5-methylcytosine-specific restriction enzyme A
MARALSVCSSPGCYELVKSGKCGDCRKAARKRSDRNRPNAGERGYDAKWRRTRARFLQLNPWCSEPGCSERATEVDHIDGLGPLSIDGHKHRNLRGFCKPHHSKRTARDQPGGWNASDR